MSGCPEKLEKEEVASWINPHGDDLEILAQLGHLGWYSAGSYFEALLLIGTGIFVGGSENEP